MKNRLIIFTIALLFLFLVKANVQAQQATDSATPSAQEIQQSLTDRIKKAIQGNINNNLQEPVIKAFIGTVTSIAENTITITTSTKETKHVIFSNDTNIVRSSTKVKPDGIKIGEGIIGMGLTTDMTSQDAIRIVLYTPQEPKYDRNVIIGTINYLNISKNTISLNLLGKNNPSDYVLSSRLTVLDQDYTKSKSSELKSNQKIVAVVFTDLKTDKITITQIRIIEDEAKEVSPSPTNSTCGDKVCQNVVCQGIGCPQPETPETCPADCTK